MKKSIHGLTYFSEDVPRGKVVSSRSLCGGAKLMVLV